MGGQCHRRLRCLKSFLMKMNPVTFSLQIAVGVNSLLGCNVSIKYKLILFKALGQI